MPTRVELNEMYAASSRLKVVEAEVVALKSERKELRAKLKQQTEMVEKCMVAMNGNAERGEKAEKERDALTQQEPVAYRAWFDKDNGARWLFTLWPEEERLDVDWEPLFTAPKPTIPAGCAGPRCCRTQAHQPVAPATGAALHHSGACYKYPAHLAAHDPGLTRPPR